jgi:hypothetical protein
MDERKTEYVEREALMKDISESVLFSVKSGQPSAEMRGANKVIDRIKSFPAADMVEVRHGYWKDNRNGTFTCSACGGQASKMDWCGRCGAKMDGRGGR